jgi:putative ABC transport system ATP-binding protein
MTVPSKQATGETAATDGPGVADVDLAPGADGAGVAARIVGGVKVYGAGPTAVRALDGISAEFRAGQFTAIMGSSGSGKSTLLHCLAGLDRLTSGQVLLGGVDLGTLDDKAMTLLRRERIGFVFQAFNLIPTLTARENILLPLTLGGRKPARGWVRELARTLGIADRLGHRPAELSGGQQQRVATARALVTRPDLIFADEPTGSLDSRSATGLLSQIRQAVEEYQQTVVMVTHDARAAAFADRVLFLADGQLVRDLAGPTADRILDTIRELGDRGLTREPGRSGRQEAGHVAGDVDGRGGAPAALCADRAGRTAGRGVHRRHVRAERHHQRHVQRPL